jgi:hypothetical protein
MLKDALRTPNVASTSQLYLGEVGKRGGFGIESRNGLDKPRNGERIAHAAGAADEAQRTAFASQLDGNAHQCGNAGAIDLRNTVEIDDDLVGAGLRNSLKSIVQLLAGLPYRQTTAHFENRDCPGLSNSDFHGRMLGHKVLGSKTPLRAAASPASQNYGNGGFTTAMHYTMAAVGGKNGLEKNCRGGIGHRQQHP